MVFVFVAGAALSLVLFVLGIGLALKDRGRRSTRRGPEVYQELVDSSRARDDLGDERGTHRRWSKAWGDGFELRGDAEYTWPEMIRAWRARDWRFLAPVLLSSAGALGMLVFCGCALLLASDGELRLFGCAFLVFTFFMILRVRKLLRTAVSEEAQRGSLES